MRIGGKLRRFKKSQVFERKKAFGINDRNNRLIEDREPSVPVALLALERE